MKDKSYLVPVINKKNFLAGFIFITLMTGVAYGDIAKEGSKAPSFAMRDLEGKNVYLSDFCGDKKEKDRKVLILSFFQTWCVPCVNIEEPVLKKLYEEYQDKGLEILLVGFRERKKSLKKYVEKKNIKYPVLLDKYGKTGEKYGVYGLPRTFLIDKDCKVVKIIIGAESIEKLYKSLSTKLDELLYTESKSKPPLPPKGKD